ncbi:Golgin candidate 6, partial [Cucurbita argyrosperma subsp. sororia]
MVLGALETLGIRQHLSSFKSFVRRGFFYVRYYALQLLTALLSNSPTRSNSQHSSRYNSTYGHAYGPITLRTSSTQEYFAVDYVFKCFCEKNSDGQTMLASTLIPQPQSMIHAPLEEDVNMSFGSMLLRSLTLSENNGDLEFLDVPEGLFTSILSSIMTTRAASVLTRYLAVASSMKNRNGKFRQGLRLLNKARLLEFGEDVDKLLEGIGDDLGLPNDDEDDGDDGDET